MRRLSTIVIPVLLVLGAASALVAQFTPAELAERAYWEEFLRSAKIIKAEQPWSKGEAVTEPWKFTLQKDGVTRCAVWKYCEGRINGFDENWRWEIAAYRLDKALALNMVPPTVERRFGGRRGSLQLWVDSRCNLRSKIQNNIATPVDKNEAWLRSGWLQQAFDNLIANVDRHTGNVLVTEDFRAILIDHSRTFRCSPEFTDSLVYLPGDGPEGAIMWELPRTFIQRLRDLNRGLLYSIAGDYLTDREIQAVLKRRQLLLDWVDAHIRVLGEDRALY